MEVSIKVNGEAVTLDQLIQIIAGIDKNPIDIFLNYAAVCMAEGIDPVTSLPFPHPVTKKQVSVNGAFKLETIFEAFNKRTGDDFNELWEPDYTNQNQLKWYPWHQFSASRGAFVSTHTSCTYTSTYLGARLCTKTDELATYIGEYFAAEWNEFLNPQI